MRDLTKPEPEANLTLFCQLGCGTVVGTVYTHTPMTEDEYRAHSGIIDQRCSECEAVHGTFKELSDEYQKKTGDDGAKTEAFIINNRTRSAFNSALSSELDKREKAAKKAV